jgi:hypothetical protein
MLRRQRDNSWGVVNGQSIAKNIYCIGVLGCGRGKCDVDFLGRGHLKYRQSDACFWAKTDVCWSPRNFAF